jgi:hypothetical protein
VVKLIDFRKKGSIKDLLLNEKEDYINYLSFTYKDNLKASEYNLIKFPRWSIIAGYYAMHDLAKLYLGINFQLKLSSPNIHAATIQALRELVKRKDIIKYLEEAQNYFELHRSLMKGKEEREKTQYYSLDRNEVNIKRTSYFFDNVINPFINILEGMINDI